MAPALETKEVRKKYGRRGSMLSNEGTPWKRPVAFAKPPTRPYHSVLGRQIRVGRGVLVGPRKGALGKRPCPSRAEQAAWK
jgi:ribosomal protein L13E